MSNSNFLYMHSDDKSCMIFIKRCIYYFSKISLKNIFKLLIIWYSSNHPDSWLGWLHESWESKSKFVLPMLVACAKWVRTREFFSAVWCTHVKILFVIFIFLVNLWHMFFFLRLIKWYHLAVLAKTCTSKAIIISNWWGYSSIQYISCW